MIAPGSLQAYALKAQYAPRAAGHAFAAGDAVAFVHRDSTPCIGAHINAQWAVVCADAALNATGTVWHDVTHG